MADDHGEKLATFMDVTGCDDAEALQMLESTGWQLEEAMQLYFASGGAEAPSNPGPSPASAAAVGSGIQPEGRPDLSAAAPSSSMLQSQLPAAEDGVRAPLPVKREALYGPSSYTYSASDPTSRLGMSQGGWSGGQPQPHTGDNLAPMVPSNPFHTAQTGPPAVDAFRDFGQEAAQRAAARAASGSGAAEESSSKAAQANLAAMYSPPFDLLFKGAFEEAKAYAVSKQQWLLVNLQSNTEFHSHLMNRDTWSDEMVKNIVSGNFVLWQVDNSTIDGRKIMTYYKLDSAPVTMVINPRTGQRQKSWEGFIQPHQFLEDIMPFIDEPPTASRSGAPPPPKKLRDRNVPAAAAPQFQAPPLSDPLAGLDEDEQLRLAMAASLETAGDSTQGGAVVMPRGSEGAGASSEAAAGGGASSAGGAGATAAEPPKGTGGGAEGEEGGAEEAKAEEAEVETVMLPEEPAQGVPDSCGVAVRLLDGRRIKRRFLLSDPLTYLGAFCRLEVPEAAAGRRFELVPARGAPLDLSSDSTIKDVGVANSLLAFKWA